ncbi:thiamine biosynthesis protein ThiT [Ureibacillus massiliensis 4400831 = CIP 108448 = CCUG 49529]|uniref:Thiamine biosynthesis protein ThiT n=1 Tax=Ureibacillus massiliensis 4400831 = CIP 108448 = CCUG 49529 TaxID=1211035 RepID=A0A0A3JJT8_9BACL|nr:energy-coupled thiamine transporter ThiT [Ureibacillus massiliensis]KGR87252.1 thiamine biosynthesis protein ThiT [Ureibacillus massiliensis 4400831 = CIP 108448 = CCUG 49529]
MNKSKLLMLVEIAIFAGVGLVLDQISFSIWAQGGSISFVMLPIILMAIRWGLLAGVTTGLLIGVIQIALGGFVIHWVQGMLDYVVAFPVVGLAGIFRTQILEAAKNLDKKKISLYIILGTTVGGLLRYVAHSVAGAVFFYEYAGDQNVWVYTILYNGSYMIPAIILTGLVGSLIFTSAPRLLKTN